MQLSEASFIAPERLVRGNEFVVRSYLPGDGALYVEALNGSYEHLIPFMEWARPHTTEAEAERLARTFRARYLLNSDFVLAILDGQERRWLGSSGFHLRDGGLENRAAEIGMWIRADAAGQGLGTRVLCAILEWGFSDWPWERLSWRCSARNLASRRVAEKAGMVYEGTLRGLTRLPGGGRDDALCFAAFRDEWRPPL